jgi:hypothetical protein
MLGMSGGIGFSNLDRPIKGYASNAILSPAPFACLLLVLRYLISVYTGPTHRNALITGPPSRTAAPDDDIFKYLPSDRPMNFINSGAKFRRNCGLQINASHRGLTKTNALGFFVEKRFN